jgi:hypothetical protein
MSETKKGIAAPSVADERLRLDKARRYARSPEGQAEIKRLFDAARGREMRDEDGKQTTAETT